jgi:beta-lactamase regulating signal transducer with metallopeptidase domain
MTGWLFDTLLYTGLLIGFVLLVRRPAGRYLGAQFAYLLWLLPFARLLLPPLVLPANLAPAPEPVQATFVPDAMEWTQAAPDVASVTYTPPPADVFDWALALEIALSVWAGVALAFLVWRTVTYRRMRSQLLAEARPVGEIGRVRLVETPEVTAPVAFGVLDKVIALPPLFMAQPDRMARDLAIAHELAHHRGHDLLANFAAQALLALHWFNPLAWMGWRAMRRDQEAACDARVLAGRGREERVRYAALIAGTAAGQRLALAAPMACPMLGDKSIIHRLRSLSMSDITTGRRWLGRGLIAAGAFALPLTASISYSAANAQDAPEPPAPPAPPAPATLELPPAPPAPPVPPQAVAAPQVRTFVLQREGPRSAPRGRPFTLHRDGNDPHPAPGPWQGFQWRGDPDDPEFQAKMEQWQQDMEKWRQEWEQKWGPEMREHALAMAEQARRHAPEVVESCDDNEQGVTNSTTPDGRQRIVICHQNVVRMARSSLRGAREAIARNREISEETRSEVLRELDQEIERIEHDRD